jgi:hypothetical protein
MNNMLSYNICYFLLHPTLIRIRNNKSFRILNMALRIWIKSWTFFYEFFLTDKCVQHGMCGCGSTTPLRRGPPGRPPPQTLCGPWRRVAAVPCGKSPRQDQRRRTSQSKQRKYKGDGWLSWLRTCLLRQLSGFESRHLSTIQNGRHK